MEEVGLAAADSNALFLTNCTLCTFTTSGKAISHESCSHREREREREGGGGEREIK